MSTFQTVRDRDAWATIRGYVYQVDLAIERWLTLRATEVLELECGEDIDVVTQAIVANEEKERDRLLNQVKSRDSRLSLRSPEALEAIACFIEHRLVNPGLHLLFRFTTNARLTCERPAVFEGGIPAISVWMRLNRGELPNDEARKARELVRTFLISQRKPAGVNKGTWNRFLSFLESANDTEFAAIISAFEWEAGQTPTDEMGGHIRSLLMERGHAPSARIADDIYRRLFLYVFKLLCSPGPKTLTRTSLKQQFELPPLSTDMRLMLARLQAFQHDVKKHPAAHGMRMTEDKGKGTSPPFILVFNEDQALEFARKFDPNLVPFMEDPDDLPNFLRFSELAYAIRRRFEVGNVPRLYVTTGRRGSLGVDVTGHVVYVYRYSGPRTALYDTNVCRDAYRTAVTLLEWAKRHGYDGLSGRVPASSPEGSQKEMEYFMAFATAVSFAKATNRRRRVEVAEVTGLLEHSHLPSRLLPSIEVVMRDRGPHGVGYKSGRLSTWISEDGRLRVPSDAACFGVRRSLLRLLGQ